MLHLVANPLEPASNASNSQLPQAQPPTGQRSSPNVNNELDILTGIIRTISRLR